VGVAGQIDRSPVAAVAARGSAPRHVLLTAEGYAAVPAASGPDVDGGFVEEDQGRCERGGPRKPGRTPGSGSLGGAGGSALGGQQDVDVGPAPPPVLELDDAVHL